MAKIKTLLPEAVGTVIDVMWQEFEDGLTPEARLCRALDTLEVQIQHNLAELDTWEPPEFDLVRTKLDGPCAHDRFLQLLCQTVQADAMAKINGSSDDADTP